MAPSYISLQRNAKKLWKPAARLLVTGLALFLILRTVDTSALLPLFANARFLYVGLALGVTLLIRVLMAWKWKLLLHYSGIELPLGYLLRIVLVSAFMGFFLPSSVGVDVIRTAAVGRRTGFTVAAVSTIADRVMAVVAMALWSLTATAVALWAVPHLPRMLWFIAALCVGLVAVIATLLSNTAIRIVQRAWGNSRARLAQKPVEPSGFRRLIRRAIDKAVMVHDELNSLLAKPPAFVSAFLLNVLFQGGRIMIFYLLFRAVGAQVPFVYHIIFAPIIMFVTLLPFSFLGIGVKEAASVFFYTQAGVDPALAFAVSLWTYIMSIPPLAIGGLLYLLGAANATKTDTNRARTIKSK